MQKPKTTLAAALAALFPKSQKAISEKLAQDEFNAFEAEVQETQERIDAQAEGNQAVAADLEAANQRIYELKAEKLTVENELASAKADLEAERSLTSSLQPKADQWDAHKQALANALVTEDSTNVTPKAKPVNGLSEKEQQHMAEKQRLKALYPGLMADIDVPVVND